MKIFIAGATGVLGRRLVQRLVERGHAVTGTTRTPAKRRLLEELGARPVVLDILDPHAVGSAISEAEPEVVVHQATALSDISSPRHFEREFAMNARLRSEGTDHLLSASSGAGVRRFVAQSYAGHLLSSVNRRVLSERDPLLADPPPVFRRTMGADRHLEAAVTGSRTLEGIVLRYGGFYGPGTSLSLHPDGVHISLVRRRQFPIIGTGSGVWSFIHIDDAAAATVTAIERGAPGIYHITDDEPAAVAEWLPALAQAVAAPPPRRVPKWLGRLAGGAAAVIMMTESRGASNRKARAELGWEPRYGSWREGFVNGLG